MLNIIVCEDNKIFKQKTCDVINKYMMNTNVDYKIRTYNSYNSKLQEFINTPHDGHDIYILDIELEDGTSGIDIATDIREIEFDSQIIIESGYSELLAQSTKLRLGILDCVDKHIQYEKNIGELLELSLKIFGLKKSVKFKLEKVDYNLKYDDIMFIEVDSDDRKCIIHTKNTKYEVSKPLNYFEKQLNSTFYKVSRGCIINLANTSKINYKKNIIKLVDNKILRGMISGKNMKGLKEACQK